MEALKHTLLRMREGVGVSYCSDRRTTDSVVPSQAVWLVTFMVTSIILRFLNV